MPYTVSEAYTKVLQEGDKMGSDYFTLSEVLSRFKKCSLDFLGQRAKEVEKTQVITDDIRPLVKMLKLAVITNPDYPAGQRYLAALPVDYHTRLNVRVQYTDQSFAREPNIERIGEESSNLVSPFKKPEKAYPLVKQLSNSFEITAGGSVVSLFWLTYIKLPTFGAADTDVVADFPDQVIEDIIAMTVNSLLVSTGDPRATVHFQTKETSRKPR